MKWFGHDWGADICTPDTHAPTPTGTPCAWCDEPIEADEGGLLIPFLGENVEAVDQPWHIECFGRSITGGVNHRLKKCTCYGGTLPGDPPGLTKRQAALSAIYDPTVNAEADRLGPAMCEEQ